MKHTLAVKFREKALALSTAEDFEKLLESTKQNRSIGHKFWGMYYFDDESMLEYHTCLDGVQLWVYNEPRAMQRAKPKILEFSQPPSEAFLKPVGDG